MAVAEYQIALEGVTCASCIEGVNHILSKKPLVIPGYQSHDVINESGVHVLQLKLDDARPDDIELEKKLKTELLAYQPHKLHLVTDDLSSVPVHIKPENKYHWAQGALGLVFGFSLLLMMALGMHVSYPIMVLLTSLGALTSIYLGWKTSKHALLKLFQEGKITMDLFFFVSATAAVLISLAHLFIPGLPMLLDTALLIFGFRHLGKAIEHHMRAEIHPKIRFQDYLSRTYTVEVDAAKSEYQKKFYLDLTPGMVIVLQPGEMLPFDGISLEGGLVDASNITGDKEYRVEPQQVLRSGTCIASDGNPLTVLLNRNKDQSFIYQYDRILSTKKENKAPVELQADRWIQYFLPAVMLIAAIGGIVTAQFFPWVMALKVVLYILASACPCIFGMITPLCMFIGMMKSTRLGVTFNSRADFEKASKVSAVVFDATGTLTKNQSVVADHEVNAMYYPMIVALQKASIHAKGVCIRNHALPHLTQALSPELSDIEVDQGRHGGVSMVFQKTRYAMGNLRYMQELGVEIQDESNHFGDKLYFAVGNEVKGYYLIQDPLHIQAFSCVQRLQQQDIHVFLGTGLIRKTALDSVARPLHIPEGNVYADCLPVDLKGENKISKQEAVNLIKKTHIVAMIGDELNDMGGMQDSDLGIAVNSSTLKPMLKYQAGALLNDVHNLNAIPEVFGYARNTMKHIDRIMYFSVAFNVLSLLYVGLAPVFFPGGLSPGIGAAIMFIQTTCVLALTLYTVSGGSNTKQKIMCSPGEAVQDAKRSDENARLQTRSPDLRSTKKNTGLKYIGFMRHTISSFKIFNPDPGSSAALAHLSKKTTGSCRPGNSMSETPS